MTALQSPALLGGEPITKSADWPGWPPRLAGLNEALTKVVEQDQWGVHSEAIKKFEEQFSAYHDAQYGLAMANGTLALSAILTALGIGPGDEVILPAYTFLSTAAAIIDVGAKPVFADISPDTFNLDPIEAEKLVTMRTRAIVPVHVGGNPADMNSFNGIAARHNLQIIEDAAQAHGAGYRGKKVGSLGAAGFFSFQSSKNLTAGEGGIVLTNDRELYERLHPIYNCGRALNGAWYKHVSPGMNYRLSAFQAAVLLFQMNHFEKWAQLRESNGLYLEELLNAIPGITCARRESGTERNAYHLFIFTYNEEEFNSLSKVRFIKALQAEGIFATEGYQPLYRLPFMDYGGSPLAVTESACRQGVWLRQSQLLAERGMMDKIAVAFRRIQKFSTQLANLPPE